MTWVGPDGLLGRRAGLVACPPAGRVGVRWAKCPLSAHLEFPVSVVSGGSASSSMRRRPRPDRGRLLVRAATHLASTSTVIGSTSHVRPVPLPGTPPGPRTIPGYSPNASPSR